MWPSNFLKSLDIGQHLIFKMKMVIELCFWNSIVEMDIDIIWIFGRSDLYYCRTVLGSCNETKISFVLVVKRRKLCICLLAKFG